MSLPNINLQRRSQPLRSTRGEIDQQVINMRCVERGSRRVRRVKWRGVVYIAAGDFETQVEKTLTCGRQIADPHPDVKWR